LNTKTIRRCQCRICRSEKDHREKTLHHQINVVMGRLDEQQRRWYAAVEANRRGHGGMTLVSQITGLDEKTIRRGQEELALDLTNRPNDRIRLPGAGRPRVEKKPDHRKRVDGLGKG
jgi:hypothetical protein